MGMLMTVLGYSHSHSLTATPLRNKIDACHKNVASTPVLTMLQKGSSHRLLLCLLTTGSGHELLNVSFTIYKYTNAYFLFDTEVSLMQTEFCCSVYFTVCIILFRDLLTQMGGLVA